LLNPLTPPEESMLCCYQQQIFIINSLSAIY
jgi:hypothetical protein